ncbi:trypsin-like peptidase domain-containing protein [Microcoleus sp. MOSTC5]|uniref:trypsin-like peptidase domain-containing protein n=1 Tax=Microcoleus sp. MOSTC5 TaxID=3055378 RepID=UPI002FD102BA
MVTLEAEDCKQLITLLKDIPELATERARQRLLELAGLKQLTPMIDFSGASFVAVSEIVSYLSKYGRLNFEHEVLGLFLNTLKSVVGVQQQASLDRLLIKYDMMTPIATLPNIHDWRGTETTTDVLEKIIGENTLRPISFLRQGLQVSRSIAYVGVQTSQKRWSGTGFLVAPDLLLTNNHVLPISNLLTNSIFRFNYEETFQGEAQQIEEYRAKPNGVFHTNGSLDYTLVQIEGEPGRKWGWLPLLPRAISRGIRVNIIQHPLGQPKQISLQNNFVQYVGGNIIQYITSTLNGSSGSPVFSDGWEVLALHHAGGNIPEPATQQRYFRNEGILVTSILADLPSEFADMLKVAASTT